MKYIIEVELEKQYDGWGGCTGCLFDAEDNCPNDECGSNKIFKLISMEEYEDKE